MKGESLMEYTLKQVLGVKSALHSTLLHSFLCSVFFKNLECVELSIQLHSIRK